MARSGSSDVGVVIAAAGRGRRLGGRVPKQFLRLGDRTVLQRSVEAFARLAPVREIVVVVPAAHARRARRSLGRTRKVSAVVEGGRERQDSVAAGLRALGRGCRLVLVHDAARPLADRALILRVIAAARRHRAALPCLPLTDTVKREDGRRRAIETVPRDRLWAAQTPQGFRRAVLERAHREAARQGVLGTDESSLVERMGIPVRIVPGSPQNIKITGRGDLALAAWLLSGGRRVAD